MSTANGLPLRSFEVEGYRAIRHLLLPDLERVNLFVGRNNAGKTSLLEAVRLYATAGSPSVLAEILCVRNGISESGLADDISAEEAVLTWDAAGLLFHGAHSEPSASITLGPTDAPADRLSISLVASDGTGESIVWLERGERRREVPLTLLLRSAAMQAGSAALPAEFVPAQGYESSQIARLWSQAVESGRVPLVEEALRVLVPELERVYLVGGEAAHRFVLQMREVPRPVPMNTVGRGMQRWFGISLALVAAEGGVLLIDQVDAALHHRVQYEVWETIFALAERLDVQVFATTHSWDAVVGFQHGASQSSATGLLYRLDLRQAGGMIHGMRYTAEEMTIAAEQQIEVR